MVSTTDRSSTRLEILIGRSLALWVHPVAAWRSGSTSVRLHTVFGYFAAGYLLTFLALFL